MKIVEIGSKDPQHKEFMIDVMHLVYDIDEEGLLLHFWNQVDDLLLSSPDGDMLISWAMTNGEVFDDMKCMFLAQRDNMKEIAGMKTNYFAIKPAKMAKGKTMRVYITLQRN